MTKRRIILIAFFIVTLFGFSRCSYELDTIKPPKDLIPIDTFTQVLSDIMILEAHYKVHDGNVSSYYISLPNAVDSVFLKYKIDSLRFTHSMDYYTTQQEILIDIYETIQDSLILNTAKMK